MRNVGSKRQIQTQEQIIKLRERFLTEVAELKEVCLVVLYEVAESFNICSLQAVKRTNREIHVGELGLEKLAHVENFLVELLIAFVLRALESYLLVAEEHEVLNQYLSRFLECVLRVNRTVRCDFEHELIIVGLLLNTIRLYCVLHVTDWGVDRIDWNYVDISAERSVLIGCDIATTLVDSKIYLH